MTLIDRFRRDATCTIPRPFAALAALALLALPAAAQRSGPLVDARLGEGELEQAGDSEKITESRVVLRADGTAWIEARGRGRAYEFSGQWRQGDRELVGLALRGASGATDYALDFRAAPPAPRPGRAELSEEVGYNLEGGDYTSVCFETLRECQAACRRDDRCRAYTYNTRSRTCYLKERVGRYQRRDDTVSGDKGEGR
jgi:hypothetical protein